METKKTPTIYKGECGNYLCHCTGTWGSFEAWATDGKVHYLHDDRDKTWEDAKKARYPLKYSVGGYSCGEFGQKKGSFTIYLLQCNTRKLIKPFTGNCVIAQSGIVFRRRIPWQNVPKFIKDALTPTGFCV